MRAPVLTFKRARALRRTMSLPEVILWQSRAIVQAAAPSTAFGGPPPPRRGGGTANETSPEIE